MIKTKMITLKPLSRKDTDFILELRNNLEIANQFFSEPPLYDYEHDKWLNNRDTKDMDFIIIINETGEKAGRIYINNVDYRNQKGEYGVVLHPDFRGKKLALHASEILLNYVFENLPINKIYLKVFSENKKALKLYEKLGFVQEGCLRKDVFKNGRFKDVLIMALFKEKWMEKHHDHFQD